MKKFFALAIALFSGIYLLLGPIPDPLPLLDEGLALVVFLNCLAYLGLDLRGIFGRKAEPAPVPVKGQVVSRTRRD